MTQREPTPKTPETFKITRLIALDFDGTIADTFQKSPADVGVEKAYERAIAKIFNDSAVEKYKNRGGLRNRAPLEIVQELAPRAKDSEIKELLTSLIASKLDVLVDEIGKPFEDGSTWPRPVSGYFEFLEALDRAHTDGQHIDTLILSSGHEPFIRKVYESWDIQKPDHIVAQETTEKILGNIVKPSSLLMNLAHHIWSTGYRVDASGLDFKELRSRTLYVGDSKEQDGKLAENSHVSFVLIDPEDTAKSWQKVIDTLSTEESK